MNNRLRLWLLGALIIFLPLSAWLVSFTGHYLVSLGRDILLGLFLLASLYRFKNWRQPTAITWLSLIFILATLLSYIGRQDSLAQWLRGVRYLAEPLLLLIALQLDPLPAESLRPLGRVLATSVVMVIIAAIIDYLAPNVWRFSLHPDALGFLGQLHFAANLPRLQATLAGPNALGLFMLVGLLLMPVWLKPWPKWLATLTGVVGLVVLALTFSRSSYVGLLAGVVFLLIAGRSLITHSRTWLVTVLAIVVISGLAVAIFKPSQLTRFGSNEMRLTQYSRVWTERSQIGFFGRGAGTTGLVSEYSFDNSPNHFSENTYLDIYENIGPLGALAYLAVWVWLIVELTRRKTLFSLSAGAAAFGLVVAGLFIDHFTGQAALWLTVVFAGLLLSPLSSLEPALRQSSADIS